MSQAITKLSYVNQIVMNKEGMLSPFQKRIVKISVLIVGIIAIYWAFKRCFSNPNPQNTPLPQKSSIPLKKNSTPPISIKPFDELIKKLENYENENLAQLETELKSKIGTLTEDERKKIYIELTKHDSKLANRLFSNEIGIWMQKLLKKPGLTFNELKNQKWITCNLDEYKLRSIKGEKKILELPDKVENRTELILALVTCQDIDQRWAAFKSAKSSINQSSIMAIARDYYKYFNAEAAEREPFLKALFDPLDSDLSTPLISKRN